MPSVTPSPNELLPTSRDVATQYDEEMREWNAPADLGPYQFHPAVESLLRLDMDGMADVEVAALNFMQAEESALRERRLRSGREEEDPLLLTMNDMPDFIAWLVAQRNTSRERALRFFRQLQFYIEREDRAKHAHCENTQPHV